MRAMEITKSYFGASRPDFAWRAFYNLCMTNLAELPLGLLMKLKQGIS